MWHGHWMTGGAALSRSAGAEANVMSGLVPGVGRSHYSFANMVRYTRPRSSMFEAGQSLHDLLVLHRIPSALVHRQ